MQDKEKIIIKSLGFDGVDMATTDLAMFSAVPIQVTQTTANMFKLHGKSFIILKDKLNAGEIIQAGKSKILYKIVKLVKIHKSGGWEHRVIRVDGYNITEVDIQAIEPHQKVEIKSRRSFQDMYQEAFPNDYPEYCPPIYQNDVCGTEKIHLSSDCQPVFIVDSDGTTMIEVPAGGNFNCTRFEDVQITDSDGITQYSLGSGETFFCQECGVVTLTLNHETFLSLPANSTQDISLIDQNQNVIIPTSVVGTVVNINIGAGEYLPSGTYTPKNEITGPFDLLWEINSPQPVETGDGYAIKLAGAGTNYNTGVWFQIPHSGDFEVNFKATNSTTDFFAGLGYYKQSSPTDAANYYTLIDFSMWHQSNGNVYDYVQGIYQGFLVGHNDDTIMTFKRIGLTMQWWVDGVFYKSVPIKNNGEMYFTMSALSLLGIRDVEVVIP